ncbi:MAG TPA: hypothetical protein VJV75_04975 [Candidatus Polarisedimenticolia bacterium]|nr:hypothetical protein [Candidatus Polarisedimenticolia bacterium]
MIRHCRFAAFVLAAASSAAPLFAETAPASPPAAPGATVVRFEHDPLGGGPHAFVAEGETDARFVYVADIPARFPTDRRGSLRVLYDTTLPTGRISLPIDTVLATDGDFSFGAVMTIHSDGFVADPNGFSQVAFGLWNAHTTGLGRTLFPSDSYDLVEFDWFANVGEFGGPFLSPSIFGGNVGNNAFFNFGFASTETTLPLDTPLLCHAVYRAADRRLTVTVHRYASGMVFTEIPGAKVTVDLSTLSPGFLVDVLGIAAYGEGWPSLHATVDYDLLYIGPVPEPLRTARGARVQR